MAIFEHEPAQAKPAAMQRPSFSSLKTSDRLRESETRRPSTTRIKPKRQSIFREEGLEDLDTSVHPSHPAHPANRARMQSNLPAHEKESEGSSDTARTSTDTGDGSENADISSDLSRWYSKLVKGSRPTIKVSSTAPPDSFSSLRRVALIAFLIAVVVPGFRYSGHTAIVGADAGVIQTRTGELVDNGSAIEGRANSPTDTCTRWAHQSTNVNGTLYIYGGQSKNKPGQTSDTWNNNLLTLDLTKSWKITSPVIKGLAQPSGPPSVAMGALWSSLNSLFVYGGYFSDSPPSTVLPVSTWEYNIKSSTWIEHTNPQTSAGNASDSENQPVQRSAEGAGLSVPEIGRSWYFGGHLDMWTTPGWSAQVYRVYLKSFLEFTHPGYANTGVKSLGSTKAAGSDGVYRNITEGGLQESSGFTERADGVLVYVPGWGDEGIILGLAGGTNVSFTEMNIIDVYDVAHSAWYKQSTSGTSPGIRVNPCAVVAAAPDGTSFNVYLYGGQNLIPAGSQTQYDDMWILTIPSFTWIQVDTNGQSKPPARAGHTCTIWDGQMVVVGGYVGKDISCDSPGIYVFNASSLQWTGGFTSLSGKSTLDDHYGSSISRGSFGYQVPAPVQSVIGGGPLGGATAAIPAAGSATAGPIATGKPPTFTVTQSGSTVVQTVMPTGGTGSAADPNKSGANVGAISVGVVAAVLAALAGYLAFCTWLYRKQLHLYKDHVALAQRRELSPVPWGAAAGGGRTSQKVAGTAMMLGPFGTDISNTGSNSIGRTSVGSSNNAAIPSFTSSSDPTSSSSGPASDSALVMGGGTMPGGGIAGKGYGYGNDPYSRLSEENEGFEYGGHGAGLLHGGPNGSTAHSSTEDLLNGQEPTFFNVILNPRRTLRVVNSD